MFERLRYSQGEFANYEPSGYYMYHQFNIQQFYVLPTQCIYVFCVDLRTNSDYFPIQRKLTGFCNRDGVCLLCGTETVYCKFTLHNALPWLRPSVTGLSWWRPTFDLRSVFLRFVGGKVAVGQFFPQYFCFPLSVYFHHYSTLILIYMLL